MAVFTSNQVNHVYVAKAVQSSALSAIGDIMCKKTADGELYFVYKNGDGGVVRSDLIPIKNIMWARAVSGNHRSQKRALKKYEIGIQNLVSGDVDKTALTVVLEKTLHNGIETVYRKTATVLVKSTTIADVVDALKLAIDNSFSRDDYVKDDFTITTTSSGNNKKVVITENAQSSKYKRGVYANEAINFRVFTYDTDKMVVTGPTNTSSYIYNAYDIADLEYFALGERGDKYRNIGWPNAFPSKCVADDPTDSAAYNILQIHFAFTDSNEGVQKSEKDITIAIPMDTPDSTASPAITAVTTINALLSQLAFNVLGAGGNGHGGSTGNDAFDLADTKVEVLDIPGGKKTELS